LRAPNQRNLRSEAELREASGYAGQPRDFDHLVRILDQWFDALAAHSAKGLPLAKENIVDEQYVAVGPLLPLRLLMGNP